MKTQQRSFVVEFKSRRRSTNAPASIWGDTDIKALVLEAEVDAPHLFAHPLDSHSPASDPDMEPDQIAESSIARVDQDVIIGDGTGVETLLVNANARTSPEPDADPVSTAGSIEPTVKTHRQKSPKPRFKGQAKPDDGAIDPSDSGLLAVDREPVDWIELDAENKHLKRMLSERLSKENAHLRELLARFGLS